MVLCEALKTWISGGRLPWEHEQPSLPKGVSLPEVAAPSPSTSFANKQHVTPLGSTPTTPASLLLLRPGPTGFAVPLFHCQFLPLSVEA